MVKERWPTAVLHEGEIPEGWVLEDMCKNDWNYFRLYKTPEGKLYYTVQPVPKERTWPRYDLRQENGREYARPRWRRKLYEAR